GGSSYDRGSAIAVDGTGRAIVTGGTGSSDFPTTPGAFDPSYNGDYTFDAFVARLNATGSMLDYATYLGGRNHDEGLAIAVDGAGRVTVTGRTNSGDFPITPGAFDPTFNGDDDAFVSKLDLEEPTVVTLAALQAGDAGAPSVSIWLLMALPAAALAVGAALAQRQRCAPTGRRSTKAT
ncbi:MAG: SBBP repeat-containing protein, partial [Anaerolineae bacterium]|nr:SBBP repeat-containing protein [Anaerolineae bacterium]